MTTPSTSSTRPATSTSPSRWSGRCGCSTAPWPCSTAWPGSSRSPRPSGGRPTGTACRGSASSTRWTGSGAEFHRCVEMIIDRLGATPLVIQLPWGVESDFRGVIDLVRMRALLWQSEGKGETYDVVDIPADHLEAAREWRDRLLETISENDEEMMELYLEGTEPDDGAAASPPSGGPPSPAPSPRCCAAARSRTRASSRCSTRSWTSCRARSTSRPIDGPRGRRRDGRDRAARRPGRAVLGARVQDHVRPAPGQADLPAGLLGHPGVRHVRC